MAKREVRTKIALGVFAVVLVGIIIGMIVWIVKSKNSDAPAPAPAPSASPSPVPRLRL
jgi:flagellar basal body-associated protein FliL